MTDDEIDAALQPLLEPLWECGVEGIIVMESERRAYRAGMREAAKIARMYEGARLAADDIEREAAE